MNSMTNLRPSYDEFEDEAEQFDELFGEHKFSEEFESVNSRTLSYTTKDVIDKRISVPAQHALVRLSKDPATNAAALNLLDCVKSGQLAGIYCVNWKDAANRAKKLGKSWWTIIPSNEDSVMLLDPENPLKGPPIIAFRRELDPRNDGCGTLKTDKSLIPNREKLDAALIRMWDAFVHFLAHRTFACDGFLGLSQAGSVEPTIPQTCRIEYPDDYCNVNSGGRQIPFQHMWNLIICHYYHGLSVQCNQLNSTFPPKQMRDIFSPELIIAIFWEETRFKNIPQLRGGPARGFGQVENRGRIFGCRYCRINPPWTRKDILRDDVKSVQISGMCLWDSFAKSNATNEYDKKIFALRAYAGWFERSPKFKGTLVQWRQCRQIIIRGWIECEQTLKRRNRNQVSKSLIIEALKKTKNVEVSSNGTCKPTKTYVEASHGQSVFPHGDTKLLDLGYSCNCNRITVSVPKRV